MSAIILRIKINTDEFYQSYLQRAGRKNANVDCKQFHLLFSVGDRDKSTLENAKTSACSNVLIFMTTLLNM